MSLTWHASPDVVRLTCLHMYIELKGFKTVKQEVLDEELQKSRPYRTPGTVRDKANKFNSFRKDSFIDYSFTQPRH